MARPDVQQGKMEVMQAHAEKITRDVDDAIASVSDWPLADQAVALSDLHKHLFQMQQLVASARGDVVSGMRLEGYSLAEIASIIGVTRARVQQLSKF